MFSFSEFVSRFFTKASPAREPRPLGAPQIGPVPDYLVGPEKIKDLTVAISSPLSGLDSIRGLMARFIHGIEGVRCITFESSPQAGVHPAAASKDIVERADVLVILIDASCGTIDPQSGKTYSQIEYEDAKAQQAEHSGRPRVLVYVKDGMLRQLEPWENDAVARHNCTYWVDADELLLIAFRDIAALLLTERQQQCMAMRDLYVRQLNRRRHLVGLCRTLMHQRNAARREVAAATRTAGDWLQSAERVLGTALRNGQETGSRMAALAIVFFSLGGLLAMAAVRFHDSVASESLNAAFGSLHRGAECLSGLADQ